MGGDGGVVTNGHLSLAARKILASRRAFRRVLPPGLVHDPMLELLLLMYLTDRSPVTLSDMRAALDMTDPVERWIRVLVQFDLADLNGEHALISATGHAAIEEALESILDAQTKVVGVDEVTRRALT